MANFKKKVFGGFCGKQSWFSAQDIHTYEDTQILLVFEKR